MEHWSRYTHISWLHIISKLVNVKEYIVKSIYNSLIYLKCLNLLNVNYRWYILLNSTHCTYNNIRNAFIKTLFPCDFTDEHLTIIKTVSTYLRFPDMTRLSISFCIHLIRQLHLNYHISHRPIPQKSFRVARRNLKFPMKSVCEDDRFLNKWN